MTTANASRRARKAPSDAKISDIPLLSWKRRTRTEWRNDFHHRIWSTHCGRYQVTRSRTDLCAVRGTAPITFYAIAVNCTPTGRRFESIISRHRTREAAFAQCQIHADAATIAAKQQKLSLRS